MRPAASTNPSPPDVYGSGLAVPSLPPRLCRRRHDNSSEHTPPGSARAAEIVQAALVIMHRVNPDWLLSSSMLAIRLAA